MAMTNAERQEAYRARKRKAGFVQVTVLVPEAQQAALTLIAAMMAENPHLEFGPLRDVVSGRLVRAR